METVMEQPASITPPSAHPAEEIREQRNIAIILRTHLLTQRLDMQGCDTAYMAAYWATRYCRTAWAAARRHQLVMLGDALDIIPTGCDARGDRSGLTWRRWSGGRMSEFCAGLFMGAGLGTVLVAAALLVAEVTSPTFPDETEDR